MTNRFDLSTLEWTVEGYTPYLWRFERRVGYIFGSNASSVDVPPVPVHVPGSVQGALCEVGLLPDWRVGTNYRAYEWVENRHWMYRAQLPDAWTEGPARFRLDCQGLDYAGWVLVNGQEIGRFTGTHKPHAFDLTPHLKERDNVLEIVFDLPPRWLGHMGCTSQMTEWKTRFNYTWDWCPRLVQTGIWDAVTLVAVPDGEIANLRCSTDVEADAGVLELSGAIAGAGCRLRVTLADGDAILRAADFTPDEFTQGISWTGLPVARWWPNGDGAQPLYTVRCTLLDASGAELDRVERRVGFTHVEWQPCDGAPAEADPWLCVVNGRPVFLQGVNFPPLSPLFADLTREDYAARLRQYAALGLNCFRINACQFLERAWFYDLCDELGLLVWQEFPLTSSGLENWPPEDETSIEELAAIAATFVERRRHHVSLLLWSGSNEQIGDRDGNGSKPNDESHPMLKRLGEVARALDPRRRFIPTSPLGPRAWSDPAEFGQGVNWAVHGGAALDTPPAAEAYWAADDALFRPEVYCPGASPVESIVKYAGDFPVFPATADNPYWRRITVWWIDWARLTALHGREPADLAEYVAWSQANQALMMGRQMQACKDRFPRCGGILMWSGHDTYPLTINTSLFDFDGTPKPVADAVAAVWCRPVKEPQP